MRATRIPRYWAFLSYSHDDRDWADWLHHALETYRVPKKLVGRDTGAGPIPSRLTPIFRDRDELPAATDLGDKIEDALAASRFLIVLCSTTAATSHWANEEILTFKRMHPDRPILAMIVEGEPNASEVPGREAEECFPPALRFDLDADGELSSERAEPIAADAREAGDGRKMALMKLIAGMLGVGLDELVEREAQRRQKRLAIVAGASLAGMVVTSGLAVVAVQARDEARGQRAEAEGLIEFMLKDLRAKLEPVGRLDVMDSLGTRTLSYYERQKRNALSEDSLGRRSRALILIGEIANLRGDLDGALRRFKAAEASTAEALARSPDDDQRVFDHAQSVYWVGVIARQRGRHDRAAVQFKEYKRLADRLIALKPDKPDWQMERVYAESNLGTVLLEQNRFAEGAAAFASALTAADRLAAASPTDQAKQAQVAETLASLSDAHEKQGDFEGAVASRRRQMALLARLGGNDAGVRRKSLAAERSMGRLLASTGDSAGGLRHLRTAAAIGDELRRIEPENTEWLAVSAGTHLDFADLLLATARVGDATGPMGVGCDISQRLVRRDPSVVKWRLGPLRQCLTLRARHAAERGEGGLALTLSEQSVALSPQPIEGATNSDRYSLGAAQLAAGDQYAALGDAEGAAGAWSAGLAVLPKVTAESPQQEALRFYLLRRLGRQRDAALTAQKLDRIGYRHPRYVEAKSAQSANSPQ